MLVDMKRLYYNLCRMGVFRIPPHNFPFISVFWPKWLGVLVTGMSSGPEEDLTLEFLLIRSPIGFQMLALPLVL